MYAGFSLMLQRGLSRLTTAFEIRTVHVDGGEDSREGLEESR